MNALTINRLQKIVKQAIDEERLVEMLRNEVCRVLGSSVSDDACIGQVVKEANDRIDVLEERVGRSPVFFKPSVVSRLFNSDDPEIRRFAVRVAPRKFLVNMIDDKHHAVRAAVARRLPASAVREMLKRYPKDGDISVIYRKKRLHEAGIPDPKANVGPFDLYGKKRLGNVIKQDKGDELSDQWYRTCAFRYMQDYGGNIENAWEEIAARRFVSCVKASTGIEIDEARLLKAIKDLIKEKEDKAFERNALKETLQRLDEQTTQHALMVHENEDNVDPVHRLVESGLSSSAYVGAAERLFHVNKAAVPVGIRKHTSGTQSAVAFVPVDGSLPHGKGFRCIDERAFDVYCRCWNERQVLNDEPFNISWTNHPEHADKVAFNVVLR